LISNHVYKSKIGVRDVRPLAAAGATAIVSCGLLVLAVWQGWLGPDVGRGAAFCEAAGGLIRQPTNTFSNVGFVVSGLLIAWHASSSGPARRTMTQGLATAMACIVILLGPGSAAMHATQTALGGHLDVLSMYLVASFAVSYAAMRWWQRGRRFFAGAFTAGLVVCVLVGALPVTLPVVMTTGNAVFAALVVAALVLELLIIRRGRTRSNRRYAYTSFGCLAVAFAIWNVSNVTGCDPTSLLQGHAAWHLLDASAAYFLYRYYASEVSVTNQPRLAG
jgi:hypothetical protein